ncbi:hypothetical protein OAE61_05245, partial [Verrucomicrobiales bacterium]|nr:hypothetical protein [Verrucomicrobiales bacterium]
MIRAALFCLLFLSASIFAENGGTALLEKSNQDARKRLSGKILNESLPVLWSKDGKSALFHFEVKSGERRWRKIDLASGEISDVEKRPDNYEPGPRKLEKSK